MKPAKFKTPTCALCRRRKLRCDGREPCGPCSRTRTPVVCVYVPKAVTQLRSELPKGGACITCRQRKRRCDGNLPCHTCTQTSRPNECKYREKDPGKNKPPKSMQPKDHASSDSASSSSSSSGSRPATPPQLDSGNLTLLNQYGDLDSLFLRSESDSMSQASYPAGSSCSSESLFALFDDSISCPPPPPDLDAELFSVRNIFLQHGWQYGLSVTAERRQALAFGDPLGLTVDQTLVNTCELLGYQLRYQSYPDTWLSTNGQTAAELELYRLIRDKLEGAPGLLLDPLLCLQTYTLLCLYAAGKEDIIGVQEFLLKASNIFVNHAATLGLEDAPALDGFPKFDTSYLSPHNVAEEVRAVFSQLIFLDFAYCLVLKLPSVIDPRLVEKFRRLVVVHWSDTEINFLRAKSILFLSDSKQLVASWDQRQFGDPAPTAWSKRYWSLVEDTQAHLNFINAVSMDVSCIPELQDAQPTLKIFRIISLAALAESYGLFADSQLESRRKHREVAAEIATITESFSDRDYQYLDSCLSLCWSIAARILYQDASVAGAPEWNPGSGTHSGNDVSRSKFLFIHECNRKLQKANPLAMEL
ncbi:hypothetical protein C8R44DRAFT_384053 [Mycena epipterygia]|nr:hypothetical protein C8R44DRAFT_384053 [Mycena epipterygia]